MKSDLRGLILNGGKSIRMGVDKSSLVYHSVPQLQWAFDLLSKFCSEVFVSCKTGTKLPVDLPTLYDKYDFESPLNGILSALEHDSSTAWITIPVDMPGLTSESLQFLVENRDANCYATCYRDSDNLKPEPLVTIWEPLAHRPLKQFIEEDQVSPRKFLMGANVKLLPSPSKEFHININTADELKKFSTGKE